MVMSASLAVAHVVAALALVCRAWLVAVGVLVCVEDVVLLLVLGFELDFEPPRLLRGRERVDATSESSSSVVSGAECVFHLATRREEAPRRSAARADSS